VTTLTVHAVSMIPHASCLRYQRHRMHRACGINDTACIVHAVSMTPHAFLIFFAYHRCFACDFHFSTILISSRILIYIRKGFSPLIRGPGRMFWWKKTEGRKSRDTVPLSQENCTEDRYCILFLIMIVNILDHSKLHTKCFWASWQTRCIVKFWRKENGFVLRFLLSFLFIYRTQVPGFTIFFLQYIQQRVIIAALWIDHTKNTRCNKKVKTKGTVSQTAKYNIPRLIEKHTHKEKL
jgi:hypothetical protein